MVLGLVEYSPGAFVVNGIVSNVPGSVQRRKWSNRNKVLDEE